MRWLHPLILSIVGTIAWAQPAEIHLEGLTVPFFDAEGRLTHKLHAARGSSSGDRRRLEDVEVRYFEPGHPDKVIQRLTAADAVWAEKAGTLAGDGPVSVETETSNLRGVGFDFALADSILHLHRDVRMANADFVLTGDRATANLVVEKTGDKLALRDVRRCEVAGNLHFVALTHPESYPLREAFTDLAIYDGVERTVRMPHRVRGIRESGQEGVSETATIHLKKPQR